MVRRISSVLDYVLQKLLELITGRHSFIISDQQLWKAMSDKCSLSDEAAAFIM